MAQSDAPSIVVDICRNSITAEGHLSRQWIQDGLRVLVREVPCSGKIDGQYLLHAIEAVTHGVCVVACPKGRCRLAQGNLRAEIRMRTVRRLLGEIGLEPQRAVLLHRVDGQSPRELERRIREVAQMMNQLGPSALHGVAPKVSGPKTERRPASFRPTETAIHV